MDFQKVFRVTDKTFLGLAGLGTDVQTVSQLYVGSIELLLAFWQLISDLWVTVRRLKFKVNMYKMTEEREIKPKTLSALLSSMMYEKR